MATLDPIINFEDCTTIDLNKAKTWTSREEARKAVSRTFRRDIVNLHLACGRYDKLTGLAMKWSVATLPQAAEYSVRITNEIFYRS